MNVSPPNLRSTLNSRESRACCQKWSRFHGWEAAAIWEELKFKAKHLANIERLAMVGDVNRRMVMTMFCKPFMKATIHYFDQGQATAAPRWLAEL